jgi:hypothetical protein
MISGGGGNSGDIDPEEAQDLIDSVIEKEYDKSFFRRLIDGYQIILKRPRFWPQYDPNVKDYGEYEPGKTRIGPASIKGGRLEILETIIHEEVHHWIEETGMMDQLKIRNVDYLEDLVDGLTKEILGPYGK